jgi:hypothetical protein
MVWIHVTLATLSWVTVLWAAATAGRLVPRRASVIAAERRAEARELQPVG